MDNFSKMKHPEHICRFNDGKESCECYDNGYQQALLSQKREIREWADGQRVISIKTNGGSGELEEKIKYEVNSILCKLNNFLDNL